MDTPSHGFPAPRAREAAAAFVVHGPRRLVDRHMQGFVFEEYWLAPKAWERHGLTTGAARSLVHNGFLTLDDLQGAHDLELATISRIGRKSLAVLYGLMVVKYRAMTEGDRAARRGRCMASRLGSDLPDKEALDWLSRAS